MRKTMRFAAVAAASTLMLSACGAEGEAEGGGDTTVTVGVATLPIFAPVFVADERGYFEDRGLDVEIEAVQTGQDAVPLLSSGQLDAVAAGFSAGIFSGLETGLEFRVVGSMGIADGEEFSPVHFLVRSELIEDGTVESMEDLEGLTVGAAGGEGGTGAYLSALALEEGGLSLDDVELSNVGNPDMPAALENGSIDAALLAAPFSENVMEDGVAESLWYPPEGTTGTGLMYGEHFLEEDAAQAFFDALVQASQDLQGDERYSEEHLEIVADAIEQDPESLQGIPLYTWLPDLAPTQEELQGMESVWLDSGALDYEQPLDPAEYIDSSFSENASAD